MEAVKGYFIPTIVGRGRESERREKDIGEKVCLTTSNCR